MALGGAVLCLKAAKAFDSIREKFGFWFAFYADDLLLFLGQIKILLPVVMDIKNLFGRFSGLSINWTKST